VPDRLTRAVVDIATQLRRIADAHTTPVSDEDDAATTTADGARRVPDVDYYRQLSAEQGQALARAEAACEEQRRRAERAEQRRDQLAATLREVLALFTPALSNGKYAFYQASDQPIAPQDYQRWHAALQPPANEEQPAAGCVPGPYDDCPNCPHDETDQPSTKEN
jgi:hypothetical protein